jgi:hypothetical protein
MEGTDGSLVARRNSAGRWLMPAKNTAATFQPNFLRYIVPPLAPSQPWGLLFAFVVLVP